MLICISAAFSTIMLDSSPGNTKWASMAATATAVTAAAVALSFRLISTDTMSDYSTRWERRNCVRGVGRPP
jgi:hypothetical protein